MITLHILQTLLFMILLFILLCLLLGTIFMNPYHKHVSNIITLSELDDTYKCSLNNPDPSKDPCYLLVKSK